MNRVLSESGWARANLPPSLDLPVFNEDGAATDKAMLIMAMRRVLVFTERLPV